MDNTLKQRIRGILYEYRTSFAGAEDKIPVIDKATEDILSLLPKWVAVTPETLPERVDQPYTEVLVWVDGMVRHAFYDHYTKLFTNAPEDAYALHFVTHWQPLPPSPEN